MDGQNDNNGDFTQAVNDLTNNQSQPSVPSWGHPGNPVADSPQQQPPTDQTTGPAPVVPPANDTPSTVQAPANSSLNSDEMNQLLDLKQKALGDLTPLVEQLDQSQEEKFTTIMMMLQASDDQRLLQKAYEIANNIQDEKVRAQALLDLVNEINYFTQKPAQPST